MQWKTAAVKDLNQHQNSLHLNTMNSILDIVCTCLVYLFLLWDVIDQCTPCQKQWATWTKLATSDYSVPKQLCNLRRFGDQWQLFTITTLQHGQNWRAAIAPHQNNSATCADLASSDCSPPTKLCNLRGFGDERRLPVKTTLQLAWIWRPAITLTWCVGEQN